MVKAEIPAKGCKFKADYICVLDRAEGVRKKLTLRSFGTKNIFTLNKQKPQTGTCVFLFDIALRPLGPSARAIISSATIKPLLVAPSIESR